MPSSSIVSSTRPDPWPTWAEWIKAKGEGRKANSDDRRPANDDRLSRDDGRLVGTTEDSGRTANPPEGRETPEAESLPEHTWEVLTRLAGLVQLRPDLPESCGDPRLWIRLFWACHLHDLGKAASGFQTMLRGGPSWGYRHEVLSLLFLHWYPFSEADRLAIGVAVATHHKDLDAILVGHAPNPDPEDDVATRMVADLPPTARSAIWRWLAECPAGWAEALGIPGIEIPEILPEDQALARCSPKIIHRIMVDLAAYHDRLDGDRNSNSRLLGMLLRGLLITADHTASAHARTAEPLQLDPDAILDRTGLTTGALFPHQRDALISTSDHLIVSAPTGSGKTEAALLWAAGRQASRRSPRLFYLLPYQASMNAMASRLAPLFGGADHVSLIHSRALAALFRTLLDQEYRAGQAERVARARRNAGRLFLTPVRVLSPYQILKALFRIKGYEAMLADLYDGLIVLDEIHAYEAERLALFLVLLEHLVRWYRVRVFVMSATLPAVVRSALAQVLPGFADIRAAPSTFARFRRHRLHLLDGDLLDHRSLDRIAESARDGKAVLVCLTTVGRARGVFEALRSRLGDSATVLLLHGRFNARDRIRREREIIASAGLGQTRFGPLVVVATQAVEVSLNLDLDVLYSDPAPLDAIIQRLGRVNRRGDRGVAAGYVFREPADGCHVYDSDLIAATLDELTIHDGEPIDEAAVETWLDAVYARPAETGGTLADRWQQAFARQAAEARGVAGDLLPFASADKELETQFYRLFDGIEVLPASLVGEYNTLEAAGRFIEAAELFVPIRWGQYHQLLRRGVVRAVERGRRDEPIVIDVPYDSERGLDLDAARSGPAALEDF